MTAMIGAAVLEADSRHRPKGTSMMINANWMAHLRDQRDLQPRPQEVQNHFRVRPEDLYRMKITQSDTPTEAKDAPDNSGGLYTHVRGDLKHMCATNQTPSPVDVTA
jgi:hypothetical protein